MMEKMHVTTTENLIGWEWAIGASFPTGTDWSVPILEIIGAGCRAGTYEAYGKKKRKKRHQSPPPCRPPCVSPSATAAVGHVCGHFTTFSTTTIPSNITSSPSKNQQQTTKQDGHGGGESNGELKKSPPHRTPHRSCQPPPRRSRLSDPALPLPPPRCLATSPRVRAATTGLPRSSVAAEPPRHARRPRVARHPACCRSSIDRHHSSVSCRAVR